MADPYTVKSLTEVDDSAPKFGYGELQESYFATHELHAEGTGVTLHRIKPNKRQPFGHRHDQAEEINVILSGTGRVKLDDEIVELEALDAVRVSPGVTRCFEAGPTGMQYLVFGPHHKGDGELLQGWWTD